MEKHLTENVRHEFFGFGWEFHYGELTPEEALQSEDFRPVQLPHDWLMDYEASGLDPLSRAMNWKYGVGMYRKEFVVDESNQGRTITILFDGAYQDSTVWLNGRELGNNFYGYIPFRYDITDCVLFGQPNQLVVKVNNSEQPNTRWYSGSGIDRDVWISSMDPVHVAYNGTYIVTESIDNGFASLKVETEIDNDSDRDQSIVVTNKFYGPDGKLWAALPCAAVIGAGMKCMAIRQSFSMKDAVLWDPEHPNLYRMVTEIERGGAAVDSYTTSFGIRTIVFDGEKGLLLNGVQTKIKGMAIHNDAGQLGAAVPIKVWKRRLQKLRDMGCNGIRTAHNPADPLLLDLFDEMGFLVMDEFFDEWTICKTSKSRLDPNIPPRGYAEHFFENYEKDTETIIRRDRNHPCVVTWSAGNEVDEAYTVDGYTYMRRFRELIHRLDPTRPVTEGTNPLARNSKYTLEKFLAEEDLHGCNWFNIWSDRAELFYEPDKIRHPDWCFLVTETGGIMGQRGGYSVGVRRAEKGSGFRRGGGYYSRGVEAGKHLREIMNKDYISGVYYWTGVGYMGESQYPHRGGGGSPVDIAGFINDNWYFYRSFWKREDPTLFVMPQWNLDEPEGKIVPVVVYTSCPSVELFLNGKSYGEKAYLWPARGIEQWPLFDLTKPTPNTDDLFLAWDVPYEPGELVAVGYDREGKEIARHVVRTVSEAKEITATLDQSTILADGRDIAQLEIALLDKDGNVAVTSDNELTVTVTGAGHLQVAENGNGLDHSMGKNPVRKCMYGLLYAVVQSERDLPGTIHVEITGEGLKPFSADIETK